MIYNIKNGSQNRCGQFIFKYFKRALRISFNMKAGITSQIDISFSFIEISIIIQFTSGSEANHRTVQQSILHFSGKIIPNRHQMKRACLNGKPATEHSQ